MTTAGPRDQRDTATGGPPSAPFPSALSFPATAPRKDSIVPTLISKPTTVEAAGEPPKRIDEYIGRVNSDTASVSVAHMRSPQGWVEPAQQPDFDEFTVVLRGALRVEHGGGTMDVEAGQAVIVRKGERVRYSTPNGAEYIAVCAPAFAAQLVHRETG
jgi:ethanolamine utilization protein EutQ